jgi:pilus assembly protein CpaB
MMRTRGLVVLVALLLASAATAAVFMYVSGVKKDATTGGGMVKVVVAKHDLPTGTYLGKLTAGDFTTIAIPQKEVVRGAITDVEQLKNSTTSQPILAGEQITSARLQGSQQIGGGVLGLPKGEQALTVQLDSERVPAGILQKGDHVTVYATFSDVSVLRGSLRSFLAGHTQASSRQDIGDYTVTLAPDVLVLKVATVYPGSSSNSGEVQVTLAVEPQDAQRLVFAREEGSVWLALLAPGERGVDQPGLNVLQFLVPREAAA